MQVSPIASSEQPRSVSSARDLLLSEVLQLLTPSQATADGRAQDLEEQETKLRRKDAQQQAVFADLAQTPRPTDLIALAERRMLPGSQAAQRQQGEAQAQERRTAATQQESEFRQALAEARHRPAGESRTPTQEATGRPAEVRSATPTSATAATAERAPTRPDHSPTRPTTGAPSPPTTTSSSPPPACPAGQVAGGPNAAPASPRQTRSSGAAIGRVASTGSTHAIARAGVTAAGASLRAEPVSAASPATPPRLAQARRAPADSAAPAAPEPEGDSDANTERILRWIQSRLGKDRSVTTLRLDPPELGTVRVRLDLRQDQLALLARTDTPAAHRLLEEHIDVLRRRLAESGIQLERVEIRPPAVASDAPLTDTPTPADAGLGDSGGSAGPDSGTAGGGAPGEWESPPEPLPAVPADTIRMGPAEESLVNILA